MLSHFQRSMFISGFFSLICLTAFAQKKDAFLHGSGLIGEWNVYTVTLSSKPNRVAFSDLSEMQMNDDRNMIYLPPFEMNFTDSTIEVIHSDTAFMLNYSYDPESDIITVDHDKGPLDMQIHHIAARNRMRILLQEVEDNVILFLESKEKIKGKKLKFE